MTILARFLVILVLLAQQMSALNPPNSPVSLSGLFNGQSQTWGENDYCSPSGMWIGPATDGPAHMPVNCMYTPTSNTPANGKVWGPIHASSLPTTYAQMACGDRVMLYQGESAGQTSLPPKGCDDLHWIWIESTGVTDPIFPSEGSRISGCTKGLASMPGRLPYNCPNPVDLMVHFVAQSSESSMLLPGTDHVRFIGVDFTRTPNPKALIYALADLSTGNAVQTHHIIFDRCGFSGIESFGTLPQTAATDTSTTRGIYLGQSNHVAVVGSAFWNIYDNGGVASNGNTDSQCVGGGVGSKQLTGWGVYKFVNNHAECGSEGVILGGDVGPQPTPTGCTLGVNCTPDVPMDIEIRDNYFFAPLFWNGGSTTLGYPNRKNGMEMKTSARGIFEGNVMENCWFSSQPWCYGFDFAPKNQMYSATDPGHCPTCFVADWTSRYNYVYNYPGHMIALYTTSYVGGCAGCGQTYGNSGFSIHDNLVGDKLSSAQGATQPCMEFLATAGAITNVSVRHNTCVNAGGASGNNGYMMNFGASQKGWFNNVVWQDNIFAMATYGVLSASGGGGCEQSNVADNFFVFLNNCVNGTTKSWTVDHNALFKWSTTDLGSMLGNLWPTDGHGAGNFFFAGTAPVGFVNYGTGDSGVNPGNYALTSSSPLHNKASDGKDIGADIPALLSKIAGVRQ